MKRKGKEERRDLSEERLGGDRNQRENEAEWLQLLTSGCHLHGYSVEMSLWDIKMDGLEELQAPSTMVERLILQQE